MIKLRMRTSSIEQTQRVRLIANHNSDRIVIKHLISNNISIYAATRQGLQQRTVGTYSLGNLLVVYEINKHVYEESDLWCTQRHNGQTYLSNSTIAYYNTLNRLHTRASTAIVVQMKVSGSRIYEVSKESTNESRLRSLM